MNQGVAELTKRIPWTTTHTSGLEQFQFRLIASGGFGDPLNSYAHTMAWFRDRLYIGTTRANLCLLKLHYRVPFLCWPVRCPDDIYDLDLRAQIWRYDPVEDRCQQVHVSPMIVGRTNQTVPREIGFRGMTVFQGPGDPAPTLYVSTWAPSRALGSTILRSCDGEAFVPVSEPGLGGDTMVSSCRSLVPFKGRLYTTATGMVAGKPNLGIPVVFESEDPTKGGWRAVSTPGFGNPDNLTIFEMAEFNDCLYAGTGNPKAGYEIWKTRAEGTPPYRWTRVIRCGAFRGRLNEGVVSVCEFRGALYVGSGIQNGGYDLIYKVGPGAPELIRIYADDTWDLLIGEARETPQGFRTPLSGLGPGANDAFNGYFWRMTEFEGWLYLGTYNWSSLLPYYPPLPSPSLAERYGRWLGIDNIVKFEGGFDLFRSRDGVTWVPVTTTGFGNPYNLGARTMVGQAPGLFIGTANPFGPEVAIRTPLGWTYVPNPRGGAELWLGTPTRAQALDLPGKH
jgi:hypothetical protein